MSRMSLYQEAPTISQSDLIHVSTYWHAGKCFVTYLLAYVNNFCQTV